MAGLDSFFASSVPSLISSFSIVYLGIFLPIVVLLYAVLPQKARRWFLLAASYIFYWLISGELIVYLLLSTVSVHYFGFWLERIQTKRNAVLKTAESREEKKRLKKEYQSKQRRVVFFAVVLHIGALLILKYSAFFTVNINSLLGLFGSSFTLTVPKYIMPIGISFFTMQALSYILDVYRGTVKADENLGRLALFMSFFPQIIEGPICRYSETAEQLWKCERVKFQNLTFGIQRILYGMMKKIVIADRLNPLIKEVFDHYPKYSGGMIAIAAVCYTIQLYMDFSGTMDAVIGTAQIFGVKMPENFARPFFSKNISEFWKRWHITLGAWFKDYIFYPVTMSKPMKSLTSSARKKIGNHFGPLLAGSVALFCVWFSNGLWHGSAWNYIFFGMYHFVLILCGNLTEPAVAKVQKLLHIKPSVLPYRIFQMIKTSILVVFGELFFRANGVRAGIAMFVKIFQDFTFPEFTDKFLKGLKIDKFDILIVGITLLIVLVISILNEKGIIVRESLSKRNIVVRWLVLYALIIYIVIFGAYGLGYIPVDPMYAEF